MLAFGITVPIYRQAASDSTAVSLIKRVISFRPFVFCPQGFRVWLFPVELSCRIYPKLARSSRDLRAEQLPLYAISSAAIKANRSYYSVNRNITSIVL